jgi:hypothetical protein
LKPPSSREPLAVLRSGSEGVWWERADGMRVRVAAAERERVVERTRLSLVGMLLAYTVSSGSPRR